MSITTTRAQRRQLAKASAKQPSRLCVVPRQEWPEQYRQSDRLLRVWRSRDYLVQEYKESTPAFARLSVLKTTVDPSKEQWVDGITWDDLQRIKNECGYIHHDAVEVYPAAQDVVNVDNIRHIWVMESKVEFAWRK